MSKPTVEEFETALLDAVNFAWEAGNTADPTSCRELMAQSVAFREEAMALFSRALTDERPRPVVTLVNAKVAEGELMANLGGTLLGCLLMSRRRRDGWFASYKPASDRTKGTRADCRAWLIAKLRTAGFDVKEGE